MKRSTVPAAPRPRAPATVNDIYLEIRRLILESVLRPGAVLSQMHLTRRLGVGRTPLREALQMLQQEGLIVAERNQRPRVAGFDPDDLEAIYAERILPSCLGVAMTVPRLRPEDLSKLERSLEQMGQAGRRHDVQGWESAHRAFHRGLVVHVNQQFKAVINRLADRSRLYRRLWMKAAPGYWAGAEEAEARALGMLAAGAWRARAKKTAALAE